MKGPKPIIKGDSKKFVEDIRLALYASKIVSYAQGYMLMRAAAQEQKWKLNYGGIALMWRCRLTYPDEHFREGRVRSVGDL